MQWGRASLWPQQGHNEEDRGWMTLLQFTHPQMQKIIIHISCPCHQVLYSLFFQKIIWDACEAMGTFLVDDHTPYLVQPLPEALSPGLPPHIFSWLFLPFLAMPPGSRPLPYPCSAAGSLQMFLNYPTVSWPRLKSHSSFHMSGYLPFLPSLSALWIIRPSLLLAALFSFICSLHSVSKKMLCPGLWVTIYLCRKEWSE